MNRHICNVIFIHGKVGTGKDTVADILSTFHDYKVFRYADDLKELLYEYADWDGKKDINGRKLLQSVGNDIRKYNDKAWINRLFHKHIVDYIIKKDSFSEDDTIINICIADVRYLNEITAMMDLLYFTTFIDNKYAINCLMFNVIGNNHAADVRKMDNETSNDSSEIALDNIEKFPCRVIDIKNDSTIAALKNTVSNEVKAFENRTNRFDDITVNAFTYEEQAANTIKSAEYCGKYCDEDGCSYFKCRSNLGTCTRFNNALLDMDTHTYEWIRCDDCLKFQKKVD